MQMYNINSSIFWEGNNYSVSSTISWFIAAFTKVHKLVSFWKDKFSPHFNNICKIHFNANLSFVCCHQLILNHRNEWMNKPTDGRRNSNKWRKCKKSIDCSKMEGRTKRAQWSASHFSERWTCSKCWPKNLWDNASQF
jgi:hypothetical protein